MPCRLDGEQDDDLPAAIKCSEILRPALHLRVHAKETTRSCVVKPPKEKNPTFVTIRDEDGNIILPTPPYQTSKVPNAK
jgi:hypothetical protein